MALHRVRGLAGGAKLVTAAMPERLSASLVFLFAGGSRLEDERHAGVSHFIEHLFFKGTQKRPTSKEIADAIEGVGGFINASTDKELTAYWTRVPAEHVELGLDVLVDIVSNSKLAPADVERERSVILEELGMYQDQPQDLVQNLFEEIMWPDHPLGRDIAGTKQSVARLTRDDILEYADAHYRLPNLVIGAAGAFDDDEILEAVRGRLALPPEPDGQLIPMPPEPLLGARVLMRRRKTEQAHICLGVRAFNYFHADRFVLDLLNTVLGEGMSSRLFLNIRERLGLAYDVHSFTQKHRRSLCGRRNSPRADCAWSSRAPTGCRSGSHTRSCCSERSRRLKKRWRWSTPSPRKTCAESPMTFCAHQSRWLLSVPSPKTLRSGPRWGPSVNGSQDL